MKLKIYQSKVLKYEMAKVSLSIIEVPFYCKRGLTLPGASYFSKKTSYFTEIAPYLTA